MANIVFDLDGTLVDSSESIIKTYETIIFEGGHKPAKLLGSELVGPSLEEALLQLLPGSSDETIQQLKKKYIALYDNENYRLVKPVLGIEQALIQLKSCRYDLYIATNKRKKITKTIVEMFGWSGHFDAIYSLDSRNPPFKSKDETLGALMSEHGLSNIDTVYVGDTQADHVAAKNNNLKFIMVDWGNKTTNLVSEISKLFLEATHPENE